MLLLYSSTTRTRRTRLCLHQRQQGHAARCTTNGTVLERQQINIPPRRPGGLGQRRHSSMALGRVVPLGGDG